MVGGHSGQRGGGTRMSTRTERCRRGEFTADSQADGLDSTVNIPGLLTGWPLALKFARHIGIRDAYAGKKRRPHRWGRRAKATNPGVVEVTIPYCPSVSPERLVVTRVAAYIDGFNLYFGLRSRYGRRYHWLDVQKLCSALLRPGQTLENVTYFTARVRDQPLSEQRQFHYLEALAHHSPLLTVVDGRFHEKHCRCRKCGSTWTIYEEKERMSASPLPW